MARRSVGPPYAFSRTVRSGIVRVVGVPISKHHTRRATGVPAVPEPVATAIVEPTIGTVGPTVTDPGTVDGATTTTIAPPAIVAPVVMPHDRPIIVGRVRVTIGTDTHVVPVTPETARIATAMRAAYAVTGSTAPDTPDTFDAWVSAFRTGFNVDPADRPVSFDAVPAYHDPYGVAIMSAQNRVMMATVIAGVPVTARTVTATWRGLIPVTRCPFRDRPTYGFSAWGDYGSGRRPSDLPGVPASDHAAWSAVIRAAYHDGTKRGTRAYDPAIVTAIEPVATA